MPLSIQQRLEAVEKYVFLALHEQIFMGTASDRYAGWLGQIYPTEMQSLITTRKKKVGKFSFEERLLPIESVKSYFEHFNVLELDFTFYRPLLEQNGNASSTFHVLEQYANEAPATAQFIIKAPQLFFAKHLRRVIQGNVIYEENPLYLEANNYIKQFHDPLIHLMGEQIKGILFQQEYQRKSDTENSLEMIGAFDSFFSLVPDDIPLHIELRSAHLLESPYFAWLESKGIGYVFTHWTWMPSLKEQWDLCDRRFTSAHDEVLIRLLTPRNMNYQDAFAKAFPFDKIVPELAYTPQSKAMINETTALMYHAIEKGKNLNIILNNRAFGNSPSLGQTLANRFLDFAEKRNA